MKKSFMRALPDAMVIGGATALAGGIGMLSAAAGVIAAGLLLLAGGWIAGRNADAAAADKAAE